MARIRDILSLPLVYCTWQAPFAQGKMKPILKTTALTKIKRVLDINPRYIRNPTDRYGSKFTDKGEFKVQDVCHYEPPHNEQYDFILLNSFLHHIDEDNTNAILDSLHSILDPNGYIHILDLVLPQRFSIPRFLAKADRGDFARPLDHWQEIFSNHFELVQFEPFPLKMLGISLWQMVYFKGKLKRNA